MSFSTWRRIHRFSSGTVGVIAIVHCAVTFVFYKEGMLAIAVVNIAHVGLEPCR